MYASYNGASNHTTRVGNWQEELVLKEASGHNRSPDPLDPSFRTQGAQRCIEHTDRVEPADWKSSQSDAHQHPESRKDYVDIKKSINSRLKRHEDEWVKQAEQKIQNEEAERGKNDRVGRYDTQFSESFKRGDFGNERLPATNIADPQYHESTGVTIYSHAVTDKADHDAHYFKGSSGGGATVNFKRHTGFTNEIRDPSKTSSQAW